MHSQSNSSTVDVAAAVRAISDYDFDRPRTRLVVLERLINSTYGDRVSRREIETAMAELLVSTATVAAKQFICKKLWIMGTDISVPALGKLLEGPDPVLAEAACYALRTQESAAVSTAMRKALDAARGVSRVAIINVLGDKHDSASTAQLIALTADLDPIVSEAAIIALGKIASREGVAALSRMHLSSDPIRRLNCAHALLQAGQQIAKRGNSAAAKVIWGQLTKESEPAQIRRGASVALKG